MEPSNRIRTWRTRRFSRAPRHGKFTLITLVAIIGMMVIIGFVGNAGYVVTEKMNTQNAADAVAFSSAQWMARGMNAVTATNHLLGEVTALVVVIEGLGGPEADLGMVSYPPQSKITDKVNRQLADLAYVRGNPIYGTELVGQIDKPFLNFAIKQLISPDENDAKHRAFATIYDGKLVLKKAATSRLLAKFFANWLFLVPPPWGYLSAAGAYVTHGVANVQLVEIGVEFLILHGLEKFVTTGQIMKRFKVDVLEDKLIPAIAAHGDFLAGKPNKKAKRDPNTEAAVVTHAIRNTLDHLDGVYNVDAMVYPLATTIPAFANLRLPIEPEAPPASRGSRKNEEGWGDDELKFEDADNQLDKVFKEIADKKKKVRTRIEQTEKQIAFLKDLSSQVDDLKQRTGVTAEEQKEFDAEKAKIAADIKQLEERLEKLRADLAELERQEKQMRDTIASLEQAPNGSGNLSAERAHLALDKMDQAEERTTQWVRATYPYVDAYRAPILRLFSQRLKRSQAATHYEKWTNRFTLTKSWKFRSAYRFKKNGTNAYGDIGAWSQEQGVEPLQMYLMAEKFDPMKASPPPPPGQARLAKGQEVWTRDSAEGKNMAEDMFTLVAVAHREIEPFFSPIIYPVASRSGMTTFAQAIYYNSNPQEAAPAAGSKVQQKLGWDTLNWHPDAAPPEWGAKASVAPKTKWPWELFTAEDAFVGQARAKLNWQAKLMPVTKRRFEQTVKASITELNEEMTINLGLALPLFDKMVTH
jgi:hypothetical protein